MDTRFFYLCFFLSFFFDLIPSRDPFFDRFFLFFSFYILQGIILYVIGIPILFYGVLKINREENVTKSLILMKKNVNLQARYLAMARADVEVSGSLYVTPENDDEVALIVGSFLRRKNLRSHKLLSQIGFIVESYQEHAWFYEMWELVRKLFLGKEERAKKESERERSSLLPSLFHWYHSKYL